MKKNISINISGMIFYIEEDCYAQLKEYLASIHEYFSSYEDSREIIEDIEVRVAEIFCESLPKDKRVITQAEVEMLMTTLGSINDFQDAEENPAYQTTFEDYDEEEEEYEKEPAFEIPTEDDFFEGGNIAIQTQSSYYQNKETEAAFADEQMYREPSPDYEPVMLNSEYEHSEKASRRVYRDTKRKILGGVASGLSHYLGLDPIWIRILLVLCLTGFFFIPEAPATTIILYLIFWFIVPGSDKLEENPNLRKLFRDTEHNVIAGVSSGLATYLGISELLIRVLFILATVFFGTGIFIYAILWMIVPEANTITEKMQMRGQAVNLNNIRASVKTYQSEEYERGSFHRAILFPFYVVSFLMTKTASFLRPFVGFTAEFIRIVGGLMLVLVSAAFTAALIGLLIAVLGWGWENIIHLDDAPILLLKNGPHAQGNWYILNGYFTLQIPTFFLGLFGVMMLSRRIIWNHKFGWSIAGLWFISLIGTGVTAGMIAQEFNAPQLGKNLADLKDFEQIEISGVIEVTIEQGDSFKVNTYGEGDERDFKIKQKDEILYISSNKTSSSYRNTKLKITLPILKRLTLSGASSANIHLQKQDELELEISGTSQVWLQGIIDKLKADISGASSLDAGKLVGNDAQLELNGVGQATVNIKNHIEAELSDASQLRYKGKPKKLDIETSESSSVKSIY
jgi:phage shock protein PspC (stress-responsive transcriptional regulator)